ncbi:MAG: hypothetical protein E6I97_19965 [Chloroflexi bacterium]|nr:MAG: hypothetical protein E6I97_19965 [Chloroflexota bacterium]
MLSSRLPDELKLVAHPAGGRRPRCSQDPRGILGTLAEPTGTDGFRVLCHQFFPSSLPHLANCIRRCNVCEASEEPAEASSPPAVIKQRRPGPKQPAYGLPASHWTTVVQRVVEQNEPLRTVAAAYGVSHETIRRILLLAQKQCGQPARTTCVPAFRDT